MFSLTMRQRCTSPCCMVTRGRYMPFTSVAGCGGCLATIRFSESLICWKASSFSLMLLATCTESSPRALSTTSNAPDMPLTTWMATEPCLWGWYQCVPGDCVGGMRKPYWKVPPLGATCSSTSSAFGLGETWNP
jgi:hypothetical protein